MTIGNLSSANSVSSMQKPRHQKPQEIQDLETALKSGDLDAAKKAVSQIQDKLKSNASASGTAPSGKSAGFATDLAAISKALNAGDMSTAVTEFNAMESKAKAHRHSGGRPPAPPPADSQAEASGSSLSITA